jgi:hypothetical protein
MDRTTATFVEVAQTLPLVASGWPREATRVSPNREPLRYEIRWKIEADDSQAGFGVRKVAGGSWLGGHANYRHRHSLDVMFAGSRRGRSPLAKRVLADGPRLRDRKAGRALDASTDGGQRPQRHAPPAMSATATIRSHGFAATAARRSRFRTMRSLRRASLRRARGFSSNRARRRRLRRSGGSWRQDGLSLTSASSRWPPDMG